MVNKRSKDIFTELCCLLGSYPLGDLEILAIYVMVVYIRLYLYISILNLKSNHMVLPNSLTQAFSRVFVDLYKVENQLYESLNTGYVDKNFLFRLTLKSINNRMSRQEQEAWLSDSKTIEELLEWGIVCRNNINWELLLKDLLLRMKIYHLYPKEKENYQINHMVKSLWRNRGKTMFKNWYYLYRSTYIPTVSEGIEGRLNDYFYSSSTAESDYEYIFQLVHHFNFNSRLSKKERLKMVNYNLWSFDNADDEWNKKEWGSEKSKTSQVSLTKRSIENLIILYHQQQSKSQIYLGKWNASKKILEENFPICSLWTLGRAIYEFVYYKDEDPKVTTDDMIKIYEEKLDEKIEDLKFTWANLKEDIENTRGVSKSYMNNLKELWKREFEQWVGSFLSMNDEYNQQHLFKNKVQMMRFLVMNLFNISVDLFIMYSSFKALVISILSRLTFWISKASRFISQVFQMFVNYISISLQDNRIINDESGLRNIFNKYNSVLNNKIYLSSNYEFNRRFIQDLGDWSYMIFQERWDPYKNTVYVKDLNKSMLNISYVNYIITHDVSKEVLVENFTEFANIVIDGLT